MPGPAPSRNKVGRHATKKAVIDAEVLPAKTTGGALPAAPDGLDGVLAVEWSQLWLSPLADTIATTDLPALRRLFVLRARHAAYLDEVPDGGLDWGSQGQQVMHPAMKAALAMESAIAALEDRFGLSVKARQAMGIRMGALAEAEAKVSKAARAKEPKKRADPRLADTPAAAAKPRRTRRRLDGDEPSPR